MTWAIIATWQFSLPAIQNNTGSLSRGSSALEVAVDVARQVEDDPAVSTVGYGGLPNINGEVELDAAVMTGRDLATGAVAAVKSYKNPVLLARHVMEDSPHTFLVGAGAEAYAASLGLKKKDLLTEKSRQAWLARLEEQKAGRQQGPVGHDTVGVVALDMSGEMAVATSTSGRGFKLQGRVGDSPLIGSGFYVDNDAGGAVATGSGEDIMKGCLCFAAVELMRQGLAPQQAAEQAIGQHQERLARAGAKPDNMAIVCLNKKGEPGASANHADFTYTLAGPQMPAQVLQIKP